MKNDYTLLIFNNGILSYIKSPANCLFNCNRYSLQGKLLEELFVKETVHRLQQLEFSKKVTLNLCTLTTNAIFTAEVSKIKFLKVEVLAIFTRENLNPTNSDSDLLLKNSVLDQFWKQEAAQLYQMVEELKNTRNIPQIKRIKETITNTFFKLDDCVEQILHTNPTEKYQFETFNFSITLKSYLEGLVSKFSDKLWITYQDFSAAYVLGNREKLLDLLNDFFLPYLKKNENKIIVKIMLSNDTAIADLTVITSQDTTDTKVEFSNGLTDFSTVEKMLLAKRAGCSVKFHQESAVATKMVITYDSYNSYRLYESEK